MADLSQIGIPGRSRMQVIRETTESTLYSLSPSVLCEPEMVEVAITNEVSEQIQIENNKMDKGRRWPQLTEMLPVQIATVMAYCHPIVRIAPAGLHTSGLQDILAMYQEDGPNAGIYDSDEMMFSILVRRYNYNISSRGIEEVLAILRTLVPRLELSQEPNLVAVNNGIFDYDSKQLYQFSRKFVFLTKSRVDYNDMATNVIIHNDEDGTDWDVESWMNDLSDDPEIVELLWQVLGGIIRPLVHWNKSIWFYSESGNNGKGTLCELMRQLCGEDSCTSISLADFSKDFMLESLMHASAIVVDENDVGTYIDKAANLKAVVTGDVIYINRKYKQPIPYRFRGLMVQCLNEMPKVRDKSDSFYRRQIFVPFTKCFTGAERKYIKSDYLHRRDVLEYVMWKVLNMNYYEFLEPDSCRQTLEEYKDFVDPVRAFLQELLPKVSWTLLPNDFLYTLYSLWYAENSGGDRSGLKGSRSFIKDVRNVVQSTYPEWQLETKPVRVAHRMDGPELVMVDYVCLPGGKSKLHAWLTPAYESTGQDAYYHPSHISEMYRGLCRVAQKESTWAIEQGICEDSDTVDYDVMRGDCE